MLELAIAFCCFPPCRSFFFSTAEDRSVNSSWSVVQSLLTVVLMSYRGVDVRRTSGELEPAQTRARSSARTRRPLSF